MNKKPLLIICLSASLVLCSCSNPFKNKKVDSEAQPTISQNTEDIKKTDTENLLPYTGEKADKEILDHISFMAIIENSKDARPQSGISRADIVYETMAEGGIPRFIALFHKFSPKEIGPIRSARPYFIDISKEYDVAFAHCGGSEDALNEIKSQNLMSLNEMANGKFYWRDKTRKAPHNLYTSAEKIRALSKEKNYIKPQTVKLKFEKEYWKNSSLSSANSITLKLNKFYTTSYEFKEDGYIKSMDGTVSKDNYSKEDVKVKNIVIQKTSITLNNDKLHVDINLVGEGDGIVISNGKYIDMKWSKKDINSPTILKDSKGEIIPLSPGNSWWHIIDKTNSVEIN